MVMLGKRVYGPYNSSSCSLVHSIQKSIGLASGNWESLSSCPRVVLRQRTAWQEAFRSILDSSQVDLFLHAGGMCPC